jgi:lauroyl/myristoyl acyltransferase
MLFEFKQGANPKLRVDGDLKGSLRELSTQKFNWPERSALMPFARASLGIQPAFEDNWYRSAWWGFYAARLLDIFAVRGEKEKISALLDPNSDWSALDHALAQGKGAVLLSAHLGPGRVPAYAATLRGHRVIQLKRTKPPNLKEDLEDYIFVSTDAELKTSLIKGLKCLKSGGIIATASTGRFGGQHLMANFLGHPLPVYLGIGEVVRLSGATAFWTTCSWTAPDRLRLILEPIPKPTGEGEEWHKQFFGFYLDRVAQHMKQFPADLGFNKGFWDGDQGLPWYRP